MPSTLLNKLLTTLKSRERVTLHLPEYRSAAVLVGLTDAAPRHTLRLQAEYEF